MKFLKRILRKFFWKVESFRFKIFHFKSLTFQGSLEPFSSLDDIFFHLEQFVKFSVNILETLFQKLILFNNYSLISLQIAGKKLIELILTIRQDYSRSIVFDFLNNLELVLDLSLINGLVFYFFLEL